MLAGSSRASRLAAFRPSLARSEEWWRWRLPAPNSHSGSFAHMHTSGELKTRQQRGKNKTFVQTHTHTHTQRWCRSCPPRFRTRTRTRTGAAAALMNAHLCPLGIKLCQVLQQFSISFLRAKLVLPCMFSLLTWS